MEEPQQEELIEKLGYHSKNGTLTVDDILEGPLFEKYDWFPLFGATDYMIESRAGYRRKPHSVRDLLKQFAWGAYQGIVCSTVCVGTGFTIGYVIYNFIK